MTKPGDPGHAAAARAATRLHEPESRDQATDAARGRYPWTLHRRLLVIVAALLLLVSAIVGVASVAVFHSSSLDRLDASLDDAISRANVAITGQAPGFPGDPSAEPEIVLNVPGQAAGTLAALVRPDGTAQASYIAAQGRVLDLPDPFVETLAAVEPDGEPHSIDVERLGQYRALAIQPAGAEGVLVVLALPMADLNATTRQLAATIGLVAVGGLALALAIGSGVVRRALSPLAEMTSTAQRVSELPLDRGDVALAERVDIDDERTEVGQFGTAFNRMLGHVASALSAREQSERKVRRFVADASHELRTPLASIRGYAELTRLHGGELPPDVVHAIGRIESESVRMTELVEDLLLLARLDEGRELRRDRVDLSAIVRDTVGDAQVASPDHNWRVAIPDAPVMVTGDDARLRQVLANLLANARIHTPEGTNVVVGVGTVPSTAVGAPASARLTVADDGPGIDPDVRANLFERFVRGDASRSRRAGSTGLGLAIVRAVIEAHRGTVDVRSEPGETAFTVELPLAESGDQSRSGAAEPAAGATTSEVSRPSSRASSSTS